MIYEYCTPSQYDKMKNYNVKKLRGNVFSSPLFFLVIKIVDIIISLSYYYSLPPVICL